MISSHAALYWENILSARNTTFDIICVMFWYKIFHDIVFLIEKLFKLKEFEFQLFSFWKSEEEITTHVLNSFEHT